LRTTKVALLKVSMMFIITSPKKFLKIVSILALAHLLETTMIGVGTLSEAITFQPQLTLIGSSMAKIGRSMTLVNSDGCKQNL
jgi:hypothetical protein